MNWKSGLRKMLSEPGEGSFRVWEQIKIEKQHHRTDLIDSTVSFEDQLVYLKICCAKCDIFLGVEVVASCDKNNLDFVNRFWMKKKAVVPLQDKG